MFAPTKTWRRWHRKINITQKRFALASAIAASAVPALVMARGHKVEQTPEIPLIVDNKTIDNVDKTSKAIALLKSLNAFEDVQKVTDSKKIRPGKGKMRNRRYVQRRGPLIVFNEKGPLTKAFRNLPGVELCNVNRLNLLQMAPGGHLGRFIIWTKDAFERLDTIYGTYKKASALKVDYTLPRSIMTNADLTRIINSDEIQSVLRRKGDKVTKPSARKVNPLTHPRVMVKLNPAAEAVKRREANARDKRAAARAKVLEAKRTGKKIELTAAQKKARAERKATDKKHRASRKRFTSALFAK